jgi:hypothetical protein
MPRGPKSEKRPADVIGAAVMVAKIAIGEIEEERPVESASVEMGRKGGAARAAALSTKRRREIAKKAAAARWKNDRRG